MSVSKLLARIVAPRVHLRDCPDGVLHDEYLHNHSYGIASDPLTQFAVVVSALIHDIDHPGVPNGQLIKEDPALSALYQNKSIAEQNSVDLAWKALMVPKFKELRAAIFGTEVELRRFRQLLVNSVIATDIFDKELGVLRKNRWNRACDDSAFQNDGSHKDINRKATIVIEHMIQASDVAHTMQHWHVYQKWNQRLFNEMLGAYRGGRSDKNPVENWYQGELGFFDHYVIPLAKKLKECSVFGASSDEYLDYATHNRSEWETKGIEIIQQFLKEYEEDGKEQKNLSMLEF